MEKYSNEIRSWRVEGEKVLRARNKVNIRCFFTTLAATALEFATS